MCHLDDAQGRTSIETDVFDGVGDATIPYYRFIPQGEKWTDPKKAEGFMDCSFKRLILP